MHISNASNISYQIRRSIANGRAIDAISILSNAIDRGNCTSEDLQDSVERLMQCSDTTILISLKGFIEKNQHIYQSSTQRSLILAQINYLLGINSLGNSHFAEAQTYLMEAATRYEASNRINQLAITNYALSLAFADGGEPEEALSYAETAAQILSSPSIDQTIAISVSSMLSLIYLKCGQQKKAEEIIRMHLPDPLTLMQIQKEQNTNTDRPFSQPRPPSEPPAHPKAPLSPRRIGVRARLNQKKLEPLSEPPKKETTRTKELAQLRLSITQLANMCT